MKVFLSEVIHPAAVALLEKNAQIVCPRDNSRASFLEALQEVEGIIARKIYIRGEEMDHAPKLKNHRPPRSRPGLRRSCRGYSERNFSHLYPRGKQRVGS